MRQTGGNLKSEPGRRTVMACVESHRQALLAAATRRGIEVEACLDPAGPGVVIEGVNVVVWMAGHW